MSLGRNVKLTAPASTRGANRAVYSGILGAEVLSPTPKMDIFRFEDGACVGVEFVPDAIALTVEQARRGAWLEFVVPDLDGAIAALAAEGIEPFEYVDTQHAYFQGPGGQVFRLAAAPVTA